MRRKRFARRLAAALLLIALAVMLTGLPRAVRAISIVDMATAIPGGAGAFTGFIPPDPIVPLGPAISEASNVAFAGYGADGQVGIYLAPEGPPQKVADLNTAIPSGTGMFTAFAASPNLSGTEVVFVGYGTGGQQGVYRAAPEGPPVKVADLNTVVPGGLGSFLDFGDVVIEPGGWWSSKRRATTERAAPATESLPTSAARSRRSSLPATRSMGRA